jgi:hypothetical protein
MVEVPLIVDWPHPTTALKQRANGEFRKFARGFEGRISLRACLKTVASAILADVESGFQPGGIGVIMGNRLEIFCPFPIATLFPGGRMPPFTAGQEARRYILKTDIAGW